MSDRVSAETAHVIKVGSLAIYRGERVRVAQLRSILSGGRWVSGAGVNHVHGDPRACWVPVADLSFPPDEATRWADIEENSGRIGGER